jgi:sarcosine oxidase subunit beta
MMKRNYDVVIIGGGVQGLSLAYNLAKNGGGNIAVFEKSYIGSGASGRNGEMLRSAFASKEWIRFFDKSLQLWETLASELDFNVMYTRCGYLILASAPNEFELCRTNVETQQYFGLTTELLTSKDVQSIRKWLLAVFYKKMADLPDMMPWSGLMPVRQSALKSIFSLLQK